jgi:hypothetical protein
VPLQLKGNRKPQYTFWTGTVCSTNGANKKAYRIFVGKPEGERPLERPRRRWVDNIKMVVSEM